MILLVRHAVAVPRSDWGGADDGRPLSRRGARQASALADALASHPADALVSSPTARCKATLGPLAASHGVKVKTSRALRAGRGDDALDVLLDAVGDVVLCTHGDVVDVALRGLRHLGWPVPARPRRAKGSVWLLSREACDYLPPAA
jgi:phosphohistidine phosphatase SixA